MNEAMNLTDEQRRENIKKALRMRAERKELKRRISCGEMTVAELLADESQAARGMRVAQLVMAVPGYGHSGSARLMDKLKIAKNRRVSGLGARQLKALIEALS